MSHLELSLFEGSVRGRKLSIEFGCGGSTLQMLQIGVEKVVSVESDRAWVQKLEAQPILQEDLASGRLTIIHSDIGPVGSWGFPADASRIREWPNYWKKPWDTIIPNNVDFVLVDGRFRVACALNAILKGSPEVTIAFHDYWNRPAYHVVSKYLTCACRADSMAIMFPKRNINISDLRRDLEEYAMNPA